MGGIAAVLPLFQALAPMLAGGQSAPQPAPPPPPPPVAPAPVAPDVSTAEDVVGQEPVVDTEAARVRAARRRKEADENRLFSLSDTEDSVVLSKSLLGD